MMSKELAARRLRRWLIVGACVAVIVPWIAHAKTTPAVTMTMALDNRTPTIGSDEVLRVVLTTSRAYANVGVSIHLPAEVSVIKGSLEWRGALTAGEKREFVLTVRLTRFGRYTVLAKATFDPVETQGLFASGASLHVIADESGVEASPDAFITMDMRRAKTPAERQRLMRCPAIETNTPAPPGAKGAVPSFVLPGGGTLRGQPR